MKNRWFASVAALLTSTGMAFCQSAVPPAYSEMAGFPVETVGNCCAAPAPCAGPTGRGLYVGFFGGGGGSSTTNITQNGTALYTPGGPPDGLGALAVIADGNATSRKTWMGGMNIGHEWSGRRFGSGSGWGILPAAEFEAYYLYNNLTGNVSNPTPRLPEHNFAVGMPINTGVFLANAVISLQTPLPRVHPYIGGGLGSAFMSVHGASSLQTAPPENGIDHFNSGTNSSCWSFATQGKAGARFALTNHVSLFAEYRLLYLGSTEYTFGSTQYINHAPTTPWNVHLGGILDHMAVTGVQFNF